MAISKAWAASKAGNPFSHLTRLAHASGAGAEAARASKKTSGVTWKPEQLGIAIDAHINASSRHERAARMAEEMASHPETHSDHRSTWLARAAMHRSAEQSHKAHAEQARKDMPQPRGDDGLFVPKP